MPMEKIFIIFITFVRNVRERMLCQLIMNRVGYDFGSLLIELTNKVHFPHYYSSPTTHK